MLLLSVLGDLFFLLVAVCHFLCLRFMYLDLDSLLFIFLGIDVLGSFVFQYFCNILRHDHVDYDLSSLLFFSKTRWTSSLNSVSIFIPFYLFVFAGYFLGNFLSPSFQFMNTSSAVSNLLVRPPTETLISVTSFLEDLHFPTHLPFLFSWCLSISIWFLSMT